MLKYLKTKPIGQVDIEQEHVGRGPRPKQGHGLGHRFGNAKNMHGFRLTGQHIGQAVRGQRFVFDDYTAEGHYLSHKNSVSLRSLPKHLYHNNK